MENRIKKILSPIDFSGAASNAMEYAAQLAKQFNASLTLWNMCEIPIMEEISSKAHLPNAIARKQREFEEILEDWCKEVKEEYDIPCGYSVQSSIYSLEKTLSHYIDGKNFDLIVTGTNGSDDMYQFFFGTNSYRIIKSVKCPVMVIPDGYKFKEIKSVTFATNYASSDAQLAKNMMKYFNANISFVHFSKNENAISKEVFKAFKNLFEDELEEYNIQFKRIVEKDKLDSLVQMIIENETDLLMMSTVHREWMEELFHKSFTKYIVEGVQIPAMVFHQNAQDDFSLSLKE